MSGSSIDCPSLQYIDVSPFQSPFSLSKNVGEVSFRDHTTCTNCIGLDQSGRLDEPRIIIHLFCPLYTYYRDIQEDSRWWEKWGVQKNTQLKNIEKVMDDFISFYFISSNNHNEIKRKLMIIGEANKKGTLSKSPLPKKIVDTYKFLKEHINPERLTYLR